jgi:hypothetical protein
MKTGWLLFVAISYVAKATAFLLDSSFLPESAETESLQGCTNYPPNVRAANRRDAKLPDPFHFVDGRPVRTKADWECRKQEISYLIQAIELGFKPPKPQFVQGSIVGNRLQINVQDNGKNISFAPTISYPSSGKAPYPVLIAYKHLTIPRPAGVAIITFDTDEIAQQTGQGSRNKGKFFDLYGANGTGALTAWAWAASRIIDALESLTNSPTTPAATLNAQRIGVTGCSRWGKGVLIASALDPRITLTLPQESGAGGAACWRLSDAENSDGKGATQTAGQIVGENVWFSSNFSNAARAGVAALPFDHHLLAGLIAPRALLSIDNAGQKWLGPMSCFGCMSTAHAVWQALGVPENMGESTAPSHGHCQFPAGQQAELTAFVGRFLLDSGASTAGVMKSPQALAFNASNWVKWSTPRLI